MYHSSLENAAVCSAKKISPLEEALGRLDEAVENLRNEAASLEDKLRPALPESRPVPVEKESKLGQDMPGNSELIRRICMGVTDLRYLTAQIQSMKQDLEL